MRLLPVALLLSLIGQAYAAKPLSNAACQRNYLELFEKDEMSMTVAFGYDDLDNGKTNDQQSLRLFLNTLTAKCASWDQRMCDFKIKSTKPYVLEKRMFGPDGKMRTLKVTTDASSVGNDDKLNRKDPAQKPSTEKMQKLFVNGLENSQVIFYMGHSRDGGGPSFGPPKLKASGHVDYNYYHTNKADKNLMVDALAKEANKPRIISILACSSLRWFSKSISTNAPASGIIGTDNTFDTVNFKEALPLMERIFSYQCLEDFTVDDRIKESKIKSDKSMKVSEANKNLSQEQVDRLTLENLANLLRSPDINVRKSAYQEIKDYDPKRLTPKVKNALKDYTFANTVRKNL